VSVAIIYAVALVERQFDHINPTTVALSMMVALLGIASQWGFIESMAASVAGTLCFNYYFLPPVGTWHIAELQNAVSFGAFAITAFIASRLSANARQREAEAITRKQEMELLYALSSSLMAIGRDRPAAVQISEHVALAFGFEGVLFYESDSNCFYQTGRKPPVTQEQLRESVEKGVILTGEGFRILPLLAGGKTVGSLALPAGSASRTAKQSIAHLAAIALDHARTQEAMSLAAAARQSEELKSAMLDALAHDFKTPLTSIKAASTALLAEANADDHELLEVITEETTRMANMVSDALEIARVEAGHFQPQQHRIEVARLIDGALERRTGRFLGHPIEVRIESGIAEVSADIRLIEMVIGQLVDNATKFSPPDSVIRIVAKQRGDFVFISVIDSGEGIAEEDRAHVFERFYRGKIARHRTPGTGMGLAIAKEIIRAHGGEIRVENSHGEGCEFVFSLPVYV